MIYLLILIPIIAGAVFYFKNNKKTGTPPPPRVLRTPGDYPTPEEAKAAVRLLIIESGQVPEEFSIQALSNDVRGGFPSVPKAYTGYAWRPLSPARH